ncbi:DUF4748 domain-containing protein isoform X2 [Chiloscyllium plagiosum]|uniref:DUF4748 domain-containing protein isoform X2 n=1 Tax=Chiloscyllium plagiosum TaxID=36176 RepID=UPI001CB827C5|nr:DUF4748 domain-containing protein isoform X2 [Chiloscyllium plagiosum]
MTPECSHGLVASGIWSCCLAKLGACAPGTILPVHRSVTIGLRHTVQSIHCNHGNRPVLRSEEAPGKSIPQRPEYIPQRRAKNPMGKIGLAWLIGLPSGIITFLLAKREVDKNRLKQLKIRQRMKNANEHGYQSERYQPKLEGHEQQIIASQSKP